MQGYDFDKQPSEVFPVEEMFHRILSDGETIVEGTSEVLAFDEDGTDVSASVIDSKSVPAEGTSLIGVVKAGESGKLYTITFRATTSLGYVYESDRKMYIKER